MISKIHAKKNLKILNFLLILIFAAASCNMPVENKAAVSESPPEPVPTALETKNIPSSDLETEQTPAEAAELPIPLSEGPIFASYEATPGETTAVLQQEAISGDLSNVRNPFLLSRAQLEAISKNGFAISSGDDKEFFALYEKARYNNEPVFITSDSLLHSYHLMYDKTLRVAEENQFIPLLHSLNQEMLARSAEVFDQLRGAPWEEAARRNLAYFAVASSLLDPQTAVPAEVSAMVAEELALINAADGIHSSAIFPGLEHGEDYTQYIPRGHYTRSDSLKLYFKSMMWYGRMTFRLKSLQAEIGREETRSAILLTYTLLNGQVNGKPALQAWSDLYAPTVFFVGRSDDLTVTQYGDVIHYIYGNNPTLHDLQDENKLDQFIDLAGKLPPPKILGMVIQDTDDEEAATKGLRFMGQRFVPDAYIFRQLIYRNVSTQDNRRGLPKGLDLFAAMGSERAYQHLEEMGETQYLNYPEKMEQVRAWMASLTLQEWTETLNNAWLYAFQPLIQPVGEGYPLFMQSPAWLDKQLNTALGSWAELKHDTILYAKQVYAELGGGPPPPPPLPPHGYVEPVPEFFARLASLTAMTRTGLESRGLLSEPDREGLARLEDLAKSCQLMAEKELRGEALSEEEYERIRFYGGELEKLVILAADMDIEGVGVGNPAEMGEDQQAAVIADVATDPDPSGTGAGGPIVLEVGVGRINVIHAVVPVVDWDGKTILQVAKGGVFSYYEFPWPADDRLTDEKWHEMIDAKQTPEMQDWIKRLVTPEGEYFDLATAVNSFRDGLVYVYWDPVYSMDYLNPNLEYMRPEIQTFKEKRQYLGHELLNSSYRSFDMQSETKAVVTARESWKDRLYSWSGDYPTYDESPTAERGPYLLDATYTLEKIQESWGPVWQVIQVSYANQPPEW